MTTPASAGANLLIKGVRIEDGPAEVDIRITGGKFAEIGAGLTPREGEEVRDYTGKLVLPPYIESHVHLDTALTSGQPRYNESGTLFEGIEVWSERKQTLTYEDVKDRAGRALRQQAQFGIQYVRSHVDVTDPDLTALRALIDLREELKDSMTLQLVAFPQEGIESFPNGRALMRRAAEMGVDAIGAIPHFEFTREYSVSSLNFAVELAQEYGLLTLATRALEAGIGPRVTASHTTAMHSYNNAYFLRLVRLLKMSGINFVSNPLVNTHLQGRVDTYPKRRGVTRVKELTEAGINVSFGQDDIEDPWNPMGTGNLRDVVLNGLYVTQMMARSEITGSYNFITHNAARTLNLSDYGIEIGNTANFIVLDAEDWFHALSFGSPVLANFRAGRVLTESEAVVRTVNF